MCLKWKVAWSHQKIFTEKKQRFFGLKMWILLSKMGDRLHDTSHYSLIWELPIGIYEGFMKVCRSPIPAQRSYKQFKKHKIEKKINGLCQIRTWDLLLPRPALYHWATEFDMKWRGKLFNRSYIIIIASLTLYPPVLIKNSTVQSELF